MSVQISASWTKETREYNGLNAIETELIKEPLYRRYAVVLMETIRITRDITDGGTETPTVRIVQIEPVEDDDETTVRELLAARFKDRTGGEVEPSLFDGEPAEPQDES